MRAGSLRGAMVLARCNFVVEHIAKVVRVLPGFAVISSCYEMRLSAPIFEPARGVIAIITGLIGVVGQADVLFVDRGVVALAYVYLAAETRRGAKTDAHVSVSTQRPTH